MGDDMKITTFRMDNRFLSNFWTPAYVKYDDMWFDSVELAYVAAKTLNMDHRKIIQNMKPGEAKRYGRQLVMRPDWDQVKYEIMLDLVRQKFQNNLLRQKLIDTGDADLEEGNTWHDQYWGVCNCGKCKGTGENMLGKILMQVRKEMEG